MGLRFASLKRAVARNNWTASGRSFGVRIGPLIMGDGRPHAGRYCSAPRS